MEIHLRDDVSGVVYVSIVARLLYPANVMAVNSGSFQALAEVSKLMLTHAKYAEWETAALNFLVVLCHWEIVSLDTIINQLLLS